MISPYHRQLAILVGRVKHSGTSAKDLALPLLLSSGLSAGLLAARMLSSQSYRYWFLLWNLALAWLPMAFAWWLHNRLRSTPWKNWKNIILTVLWLGFLPNSFYIVSDFIHIHESGEVSLLFDSVMIMSFAWNGLLLGFISLLIVHFELAKRLFRRTVTILLGVVILLCSFAIYLGRYLAWNTWDILINPAGILFDISDRIIKPASFPNTFTTTSMFFVSLCVMYYVIYKLFVAVLRIRKGT